MCVFFPCVFLAPVPGCVADAGIEASRFLVYRGAWEADQGRKNTYFASIAKALALDVANKSASDAVQVFVQIWSPACGGQSLHCLHVCISF